MSFNFFVVAWFLIIPFGLISLGFFLKLVIDKSMSSLEFLIFFFSLFVTALCLGLLL